MQVGSRIPLLSCFTIVALPVFATRMNFGKIPVILAVVSFASALPLIMATNFALLTSLGGISPENLPVATAKAVGFSVSLDTVHDITTVTGISKRINIFPFS